jgi:prevent-host-death family protein
MPMEWHLQDAKNHFSKVVQKARNEGPQFITLRGERAAVVLSAADYDALTGNCPNLVEDLLAGPAWDDARIAEARAAGDLPAPPDRRYGTYLRWSAAFVIVSVLVWVAVRFIVPGGMSPPTASNTDARGMTTPTEVDDLAPKQVACDLHPAFRSHLLRITCVAG